MLWYVLRKKRHRFVLDAKVPPGDRKIDRGLLKIYFLRVKNTRLNLILYTSVYLVNRMSHWQLIKREKKTSMDHYPHNRLVTTRSMCSLLSEKITPRVWKKNDKNNKNIKYKQKITRSSGVLVPRASVTECRYKSDLKSACVYIGTCRGDAWADREQGRIFLCFLTRHYPFMRISPTCGERKKNYT